MQENPSPPLEYRVFDPESQTIEVVTIKPPKRRYWIHALLFLLTVFTTMCIGARLQYDFINNIPAFNAKVDLFPWRWILADWHRLLLGIPFSACVMAILTAHEMGHFVLCVRRRVYATLPFFIPFPNVIGTLGAFIRIKSPMRNRKDLFDIGIAGPIAGFVVAVPVLFFSLLAAKPLVNPEAEFAFGLPPIFKLAHFILAHAGVNAAVAQLDFAHLYLHPTTMAAWFGMFATAMNLLPGGQFDGGHISYALNPRTHRTISILLIVGLLPLAVFFSVTWLIWALFLWRTMRHPPVMEDTPLGGKRRLLALFGLAMLVLTFAYDALPGGIVDFVREFLTKK